jgi:hypothetical protein
VTSRNSTRAPCDLLSPDAVTTGEQGIGGSGAIGDSQT